MPPKAGPSRQERRQQGREEGTQRLSAEAILSRPVGADDMVIVAGIGVSFNALKAAAERAARRCAACGQSPARLLACRACGFDRYCDKDCQRAAWPRHRLLCVAMAADAAVIADFKGFEMGTKLARLDEMLEWLRGGPADVVAACTTLYILVARTKAQAQTVARYFSVDLLGRGQVLPLLLAKLPIGGSVAYFAAELLTILTLVPSEATKAVAGGALPSLVRLMAAPSLFPEDDRLWSVYGAAYAAAGVIASLTAVPELRPAVVDAGAAPPLAKLLAKLRDPVWVAPLLLESCRYSVVTATWNLLTVSGGAVPDPSAVAAFKAAGSAPFLADALRSANAETASHAAYALASLSDDGGPVGDEATIGEAIASLVGLLGRGGEGARSSSVALMVYARQPVRLREIVAAGALPPAIKLLKTSDDDPEADIFCAIILLHTLTEDDVIGPAVAGRLVDAGCLPVLARLLVHGADSEMGREKGLVGLAASLLTPVTRARREEAVSAGLVAALASALSALRGPDGGADSAAASRAMGLWGPYGRNLLKLAAGLMRAKGGIIDAKAADAIFGTCPVSAVMSLLNVKGLHRDEYTQLVMAVGDFVRCAALSPAHRGGIGEAIPRVRRKLVSALEGGKVPADLSEAVAVAIEGLDTVTELTRM